MSGEMSDQEFLSYFSLHATTERALFSGQHINRLLALAGSTDRAVSEDGGLWVVYSETADPLIEAAYKRLGGAVDGKERE